MRSMLPDREICVRTLRIPTARGSIPALLLFRDGKVVGTSVGYVAKPELEAFLSGR